MILIRPLSYVRQALDAGLFISGYIASFATNPIDFNIYEFYIKRSAAINFSLSLEYNSSICLFNREI